MRGLLYEWNGLGDIYIYIYVYSIFLISLGGDLLCVYALLVLVIAYYLVLSGFLKKKSRICWEGIVMLCAF
jgi:hypothetical protein